MRFGRNTKRKMESLTVEIWRILQNAPNSGDKNTSNKEQVIAVMGPTGVGKSSFIHNAVPPDLRTEVKVGHSLRSETNKVQPVSWVNKDGKRVKLVDTPGFNDSRAGMSDVEVLKMIANFLVDECDEKKPRLTGLIYVHRISDPRVGGTALRNPRMFRKLCGKDSMKNVVIVTTMWDMVDKKEGERREQELKSSNDLFKPLLDDGAIMIGYDRTHECANRVVNRLLEKGPTTPQIVQEIVNKGVVLVDTAAGTELQSEIRELLKKHNDEMKSLKTEVRGLKQKVPEQERQRMNEEMQDRQRMEGVMTNLSMELDELKRGIPNDPPLNYEATDNFPPPDTKCIEDCSKLLRLVKECRSTLSPKPKYRDIANSVVSCTVDFADAVEKSLRSIQSASSTLKPVLKSQDAHSLQQFMRMDPHPKTFTQGTWTKAQHDMEMVTKDIEAILSKRGKIDKIQDGLKFNKKDKEKRIDALKETLKSTKEVITDMGAMVDWWIQVTGAIKYAEDAAPHKTGDASIAVGVMVALTRIIDAFDAYCEAYAACSKDLRNIAQGCSV
ncbi:P-loop containing nucleoside triphosphate hydrolase protein [Scleroderma yunnanense]